MMGGAGAGAAGGMNNFGMGDNNDQPGLRRADSQRMQCLVGGDDDDWDSSIGQNHYHQPNIGDDFGIPNYQPNLNQQNRQRQPPPA